MQLSNIKRLGVSRKNLRRLMRLTLDFQHSCLARNPLLA
jgi:hypothetical protein